MRTSASDQPWTYIPLVSPPDALTQGLKKSIINTQIESIPPGEHVAPQPHVYRKTTKSDRSVGSKFKELSINECDPRGPGWRPAAAGTKRAAEPSGQIPEGETRPSKRAPARTVLVDDSQHRMTTDTTATDVDAVNIKSEPGTLQLPKPLSAETVSQAKSDAALYTNHDYLEPAGKILLQPETRPISQDQLVNEVKGIYAGLVMVEKKCVEIDQQQSKTTSKLSDEKSSDRDCYTH